MKSFRMFKSILAASLTLILMATECKPEKIDPENPDNPETPTVVDEEYKDGRVCIAYAPYYRSQLPAPEYVTNICYCFAEVYVSGGVYKGFKLQGNNNEEMFRKVVALKTENPAIKISLSFTNSVENSDNVVDGGFSAIVASDEYRKQFAKDCLDFINKWRIDGIDLDWEFPGMTWSTNAFDATRDVDNFTLLVKQLRETLDSKYLLTFASYIMDKSPTEGGYRFIDLKAVEPYVDFINIMTYDMDAEDFQNAINKPSACWDIERTRQVFVNAGIPYGKMVLGIPFYLRHSFDTNPMAIDYDKIAELRTDKNYNFDNWDSTAQCPYATYKGKFYGSYDNPESIAIKGRRYIGGFGFKGLMYWDAGADDDKYTLARACWNATMKEY